MSDEKALRWTMQLQNVFAAWLQSITVTFQIAYICQLVGLVLQSRGQEDIGLPLLWVAIIFHAPMLWLWTACINVDFVKHMMKQFTVWYVAANALGMVVSLSYCVGSPSAVVPFVLMIGKCAV